MLIGRLGNVHTGKTLLGVKFLTNLVNIPENKDKGFYGGANFHIYDKHIKYLTVDDFIGLDLDKPDNPNQIYSGLVSLQEFWSWLYSRLSGSEISRGINPIILQSAKRGFDIDWDSQLASSVDKTVRYLTEKFWVTRPPLKTSDRPYHQEIVGFRYVYSTSKILMRYTMPIKTKIKGREVQVAERYYNLYDHREQSDLKYQQTQPHDNKPTQPTGLKSKVIELSKSEKEQLNVEQPFNTEQPLTNIAPKYTDGKEIALHPNSVEAILKTKNITEMSLDGELLENSVSEKFSKSFTSHEQINTPETKPVDISSYSNDEKIQSGVLEPIIDTRLAKLAPKIRDIEKELEL